MRLLPRLLLALGWLAMFAHDTAQASIIPSIPYNLTNGSLADATQVMGNFNTIVTDTNANAANSGVNTNITSMTGLTTPLANTYGGTVVYTGGTSTGSGNAQVLASLTPSFFALTAGNIVTMIAGFTNTGSMTLNPNSAGVTTVQKAVSGGLGNLAGGEVQAGSAYAFIVVGSNLVLLNPSLGFDGSIFTLNSSTGNLSFGSAPTLPSNTLASTQTPFTSNGGAILTSAPIATINYVNNQTSIRGHQIITATGNGTFTAPPGTAPNTLFKLIITGGGGAGGGGTSAQPGGGAGATTIAYASGLSSGGTYSYTLGSGGGGASNAAGGNGVLSSFAFVSGTNITAPGGTGGFNALASNGGLGGVSGANGAMTVPGGDGSTGNGDGATSDNGGNGGASFWGSGGSGGAGAGIPTAARAYGAGGGGNGNTGTTGGAGATGILVMEWQ